MSSRRLGVLSVLVAAAGVLASPPIASAGVPWRFIATGDSRGDTNGVNTVIMSEIVTRILAEQPDLVLFSGDLVTGSSNTNTLISQLTNWRTIMQPVYNAGIQVLAVRGNHEDQGSVVAWNTVFAGAYAMPGNGPAGEVNVTFSLVHHNAFIAGLDEYSGHIHRVNQTWLDGQFATNTQPHVFVVGHEPAFKAYHTDCMDDYQSDRDIFWASIASAGGRTYFCGHDHFYDHARIDDQDGNPNDDLHQCIIGTAGAPPYTFGGVYDGVNDSYVPLQQHYASAYGYVVIDINGLSATLTWMQRVSAGNYAAYEVWSYNALPRPGDLNADGYVDVGDFGVFETCMSGPAVLHPPGCDAADFDADTDVDLADFSELQTLSTGTS